MTSKPQILVQTGWNISLKPFTVIQMPEDVALYWLHVIISQDPQDQVAFLNIHLLSVTLLAASDGWPFG